METRPFLPTWQQKFKICSAADQKLLHATTLLMCQGRAVCYPPTSNSEVIFEVDTDRLQSDAGEV